MSATFLFVMCIILSLAIIIQSEMHRRQLNDVLNRIMARNLTEYQSGKEKIDVKRSETGNFFLDSMEKAYKRQSSLDE